MIAEIAFGYNQMGKYEEAMRHAKQSLEVRQEALRLDDVEVAETYR